MITPHQSSDCGVWASYEELVPRRVLNKLLSCFDVIRSHLPLWSNDHAFSHLFSKIISVLFFPFIFIFIFTFLLIFLSLFLLIYVVISLCKFICLFSFIFIFLCSFPSFPFIWFSPCPNPSLFASLLLAFFLSLFIFPSLFPFPFPFIFPCLTTSSHPQPEQNPCSSSLHYNWSPSRSPLSQKSFYPLPVSP